MEAKQSGMLMVGEERFKAGMYSAILHMYARIQDFDTLAILVADIREYSVHVKMNTLVVSPLPGSISTDDDSGSHARGDHSGSCDTDDSPDHSGTCNTGGHSGSYDTDERCSG